MFLFRSPGGSVRVQSKQTGVTAQNELHPSSYIRSEGQGTDVGAHWGAGMPIVGFGGASQDRLPPPPQHTLLLVPSFQERLLASL